MEKIQLGRTGLMVTRCGFGALPIQRVSIGEAELILRKAYNNGINFFDTARAYSDSEEKIGKALSNVRKDIIIATKSFAHNRTTFFEQLETSLKKLKTDYIDVMQLHHQMKLSDPEDEEGLYQALVEAKQKGMIRYMGITSHRLDVAMDGAASEMYDTVQFPLSSISSGKDLELIEECRKHNVGVIAMKALSGGLITNAATTFSFLRQFDNVVPIWGIQRESELDEFLAFEKDPPVLDEKMWSIIKKDRQELAGSFCRACGYCMPCTVGIPIPTAARISLLLTRAPYQPFLTDGWKEKMELINKCEDCGQCRERCPYELDTPELLKDMLKFYLEFYDNHVSE